MSNQSDSRWWEFYGIRYAQGAVVGAMLIYFLFAQTKSLKILLFIPTDPKDLGMPHLILLGIYGLVYCYIASAPILILHAGRGLIFEGKVSSATNEKTFQEKMFMIINKYRLVFYILLLVCPSIYYFFVSKDLMELIAVVLYIGVLALEIQILIQIFTTSWLKTIDYYLKIAEKRKKYEDSGYVESYKHLREHGNSFLIVFFEFLLAIPIFMFVSQSVIQDDAIRHLCIIIFVWVIPAAFIWLFGNKLENNLKIM